MRAAADCCCRNVLKFVGYFVGLGGFLSEFSVIFGFFVGPLVFSYLSVFGVGSFFVGRFVVAVGG